MTLMDEAPAPGETGPAKENEVACTFEFTICGIAPNRESAGLAFERLRGILEQDLTGFVSMRNLEILVDSADYEKVKTEQS